MAINITFYNFSKKLNSTKRPDVTGTVYECNLIDDCSIINPRVVIVGTDNQFNPMRLNYAFIPLFDRHYFVNDWTYSARTWIATLNVDVLASWKNGIANSVQYYSRCSKNWDGSIEDKYYPALSKTTIVQSGINSYSNDSTFYVGQSLKDATFLLEVVGTDYGVLADQATNGMPTSCYLMNGEAFFYFCKQIYSSDLGTDLLKGLTKLDSYIISLKYTPVQLTGRDLVTIGDQRSAIKFGNIALSLGDYRCYYIDPANTFVNYFVTKKLIMTGVPKHPQSSSYGSYLNTTPWSRYEVLYLPTGSFEFDGRFITNGVLTFEYTIDPRGGLCYLKIDIDGNELYRNTVSLWVDISTTALFSNMGSFTAMTASAISTIGTLFYSNPVTAVISGTIGLASTVGNMADFVAPRLINKSATNSPASAFQIPVFKCYFTNSVTHDLENHGAPCCKEFRLVDIGLNTYGEILDPHFDINCTEYEMQSIKSITQGGFYYE